MAVDAWHEYSASRTWVAPSHRRTVANVDMNETPHPSELAGELGKAMFNWYRNTSRETTDSSVGAESLRDQRNFLPRW